MAATQAGVALHDRLVAELREQRPAALEAAERLLREQDARPALKQLVAPAEAAPSFSFSFG